MEEDGAVLSAWHCCWFTPAYTEILGLSEHNGGGVTKQKALILFIHLEITSHTERWFS